MSQYDSGPYYANGGGYLASSQGGTGSPGGAPKRTGIAQSLRPVTIKQLKEATQAHAEAEWHIEDIEIGPVTVVAVVTKITPQATNCVYELNDGTGQIQARHWVDSSQNNDDDDLKELSYIRVMGNLKSFGNSRFINATHLRPVVDANEVDFHYLEVCATTLMMERGPPPRPGQPHTPGSGKANSASAYTAGSTSAAPRDQFSSLPTIQRTIINYILAQPTKDEGVHVGAIARAVGGDAHAISAALDALMDEGLVFTTIDESHFAVSA